VVRFVGLRAFFPTAIAEPFAAVQRLVGNVAKYDCTLTGHA